MATKKDCPVATNTAVMLSAAGVQRSGTPAESKHPYPGTTAASRDDATTSAADGAGSGVAALIPRVLTLMEEDSPVATNTTVMLSAAGVQRSGTPAESKHPYPGTTAASRVGAATSAADGAGSGVAALILSRLHWWRKTVLWAPKRLSC